MPFAPIFPDFLIISYKMTVGGFEKITFFESQLLFYFFSNLFFASTPLKSGTNNGVVWIFSFMITYWGFQPKIEDPKQYWGKCKIGNEK